MKKTKRILSMLLSAVLVISIFAASPVYAQEQSSETKMERMVQKSLSEAESRMNSIASGSVVSVSTYAELISAIEAQIPNIYILQDVQLEDALQIDYDVSLLADDSGITLFSPESIRHIKITASDVQIQFDNVILDGQYDNGIKGGGIDAADISDISLINPIIQNCYNARMGVAIDNSAESGTGDFSIYNGIIRNNKTLRGTVINLCSTNVMVYNTLIENNSATNGSFGYGAIFLGAVEETVTNAAIYNTTIRGNTFAEGAAINIWNTNLILNKNTVIENNTAKKSGGAIYADASTIESYAAITHNTATLHGGGICLIDSILTMQDGEISYNSAGMSVTNMNHYGGGISMYSTSEDYICRMIVNDGILQGNISSYGSAVGCSYMSEYGKELQSELYINGGTICNNGYTLNEDGTINQICRDGGGVYVYQVAMTDGIVEKNLCNNCGAGICTGDFVMSGGSIQDNGYYEDVSGEVIVKCSSGGGVYAFETASITGGLIYSNMAVSAGGINVKNLLSLKAPAYIRYNTATSNYGGIQIVSYDSENVDLTRVRNNIAQTGGNQDY